jgi:biotin carboxyl carrier protein
VGRISPALESAHVYGESLMARYLVNVDGKDFDIDLEYRSERYHATVNGRKVEIASYRLGENRSLLLINDQSHEVDVRSNGYDNRKVVFMKGMEIPAEIEDYNLALLRKTAGIGSEAQVDKLLRAAMPGLVVEVKVQPGDRVARGRPLLVIEAMKMENVIKAPGEATVKAVHVSKGTSVEKDDKLLEFE